MYINSSHGRAASRLRKHVESFRSTVRWRRGSFGVRGHRKVGFGFCADDAVRRGDGSGYDDRDGVGATA